MYVHIYIHNIYIYIYIYIYIHSVTRPWLSSKELRRAQRAEGDAAVAAATPRTVFMAARG